MQRDQALEILSKHQEAIKNYGVQSPARTSAAHPTNRI